MKTKKWSELRDTLLADPIRAARYEEARRRLEAELAAYEQTLAASRRARAFTHAQLAKSLEVSQAQMSRIEHQSDLYLSTLESDIEAMGGRLELIATFDDTRVTPTLADLTGQDATAAVPNESSFAVS